MTFQDESLAVNRRFVYCFGDFKVLEAAKNKECAFKRETKRYKVSSRSSSMALCEIYFFTHHPLEFVMKMNLRQNHIK